MTASVPPEVTSALRVAGRTWFLAGVRRRDRAKLRADLQAELAAARAVPFDDAASGGATPSDAALVIAVLGDDPPDTAREWARARGVADRRLRLLSFVLPALLSGVIVSGAVLALLGDAFANDTDALLGNPGPVTILAVYVASAVLSAAAIVGVSAGILWAQHDVTAGRTARTLLAALPIGAVLAAALAVSVADSDDFVVHPHTFVDVTVVIVLTLSATMTVARWLAVRAPRAEVCAASTAAPFSV